MNKIIYKNFLKKKFYFIEDDVIKNYNFKIDLIFSWMKKLNLKFPNILDIGVTMGFILFIMLKNIKIAKFSPLSLLKKIIFY